MTGKKVIAFDRPFELWAYHVSHRQLLLRSNKRDEHDVRVEILFRGVSQICLPVFMPSISITEASGGGEFVVEYGDSSGTVSALKMYHDISDLEFHCESKLLQKTWL